MAQWLDGVGPTIPGKYSTYTKNELINPITPINPHPQGYGAPPYGAVVRMNKFYT